MFQIRETRSSINRHAKGLRLFAVVGLALAVMPASAQSVQPPYDEDYVVVDLGPAPGVPSYYGGLTFKIDDPNTLLITLFAPVSFSMRSSLFSSLPYLYSSRVDMYRTP